MAGRFGHLDWLLVLLLSAGLVRVVGADDLPEPHKPVVTLEGPNPLAGIIRNHVEVEALDGPSGQGKALKVRFQRADWPNVFFPAGGKAWDWSRYVGLAVDVYNPNPYPVHVSIRVDNEGADGSKHCNQEGIEVPAQSTRILSTTFNAGLDLGLWGMRGYPPMCRGDGVTLDPSRVIAFQVFRSMPPRPETLVLSNIRVFGNRPPVTAPPSKAFVDRFGQYAWADFPGKLKHDRQFPALIEAEQKDMVRHPAPADRDEFGGWRTGPRRKATGWFRTEKVKDTWWLITPPGHLFFSLGMDCVGWDAFTLVEKRDGWFEWLPDPQGQFGQNYSRCEGVHTGPVKSGRTFNFYMTNLQRKYGESWQEHWRDMTWKRLQSWGFNTIANWSHWSTYNGPVPYVANGGIGGNHARVASGADYWGKMHDVFDPVFASDVRKSISGASVQWKDQPRCLGVFVDNELSWGHEDSFGLAVGSLNAPAEQPAKKAFLADLARQYRTIEKLNAAWATSWTSWEEMSLRSSAPAREKMTQACKADLNAFIYRFALRYFTLVRDAIRQTSPHHLYLGCRFAVWNQAAVRAAAQTCDVVSFNIYKETVDSRTYGFTDTLGVPCIIGEFHFGALDRGMFHTGLVKSRDQNDRAAKYVRYVQSVAERPAFVGCHWFQYLDEPLTGRWFDGENYNIGFVTVVDQPYPEMVEAARNVHREVYSLRQERQARLR
jgi:hypothetical protein